MTAECDKIQSLGILLRDKWIMEWKKSTLHRSTAMLVTTVTKNPTHCKTQTYNTKHIKRKRFKIFKHDDKKCIWLQIQSKDVFQLKLELLLSMIHWLFIFSTELAVYLKPAFGAYPGEPNQA